MDEITIDELLREKELEVCQETRLAMLEEKARQDGVDIEDAEI